MNKPDENSDDGTKGVAADNDGSAPVQGEAGGVVQASLITEADGDEEQILSNLFDLPLSPSSSSVVADGASHVDEPGDLQQGRVCDCHAQGVQGGEGCDYVLFCLLAVVSSLCFS